MAKKSKKAKRGAPARKKKGMKKRPRRRGKRNRRQSQRPLRWLRRRRSGKVSAARPKINRPSPQAATPQHQFVRRQIAASTPALSRSRLNFLRMAL